MNSGWPHFTVEELRCKCGCERWDMDDDFMERFVALRIKYNKPIHLSSAFRCIEHDKIVSPNGTGAHTTGHAIDTRVYGTDAHEIERLAFKYGFTGMGRNQKGIHSLRFLHLDDLPQSIDRNRPWIWSY